LTGFSKISPDYKGRFAVGGTIDPILAADLAPAAFGRVCGGASREIFIPGNTEKARGHNLRYVTANAFGVAAGASISGPFHAKKKPGDDRRAVEFRENAAAASGWQPA
jgi:hypothetical protein